MEEDDAGYVPKRILLFSDGTGNSSAKLFKTNVWQMYQAVDLGPAEPGQIVQIAYYNNGVGTSTFRPLAILGGVFGMGLKANILNLYRFLCRNYRPGDEIFAFGFSRGSFTVRLLIELITGQGIVVYNDEEGVVQGEGALQRQSEDAYRAMRDNWRLNNRLAQGVLRCIRWTGRAARTAIRRRRGIPPAPTLWPDKPAIQFVGVWDTVAAYGGPIAEITRAIDDWIWPLTMPDYKLSPCVKRARHALALDDARDTFQPLLWDETGEPVPVEGEDQRLKQVWFAGMHSDVGGGYPDDSLSYVSLSWMIEELGPRIRLLPSAIERVYELSNDFGPLHDSRHGLGGYYRYQPRRIASFADPPWTGTLSLRDPNLRRALPGGGTRMQGLVNHVYVHESVLRRIVNGTDGYAPLALPRRITIVKRDMASPHAQRLPLLPEMLQADLDALAQQALDLPKDEVDPLDAMWDIVWRRRLIYFLTVGFSVLLALAPWWSKVATLQLCADARCVISGPITALKAVLPSLAAPLVEGWASSPAIFLLLVGGVWATMMRGLALERRLRDAARAVWSPATHRIDRATGGGGKTADRASVAVAGAPPRLAPIARGRFYRVRTTYAYQRSVQLLKWRITPTIVGPAMLCLGLFVAASLLIQARIVVQEERGALCPAARADVYRAAALCYRTGLTVEKGRRYDVAFRPRPGTIWRDGGLFGGGVPAAADGVRHSRESVAMWLARPWRRVIGERYLAPLARIDQGNISWGYDPAFVLKLGLRRQWDGSYTGSFVAPAGGTLAFFANDAVPLFGPPDLFYRHNSGEADVTVTPRDQAIAPD